MPQSPTILGVALAMATLALVPAVGVPVAGAAPADARRATSITVQDPAGDVHSFDTRLTRAERSSIDLRKVTYVANRTAGTLTVIFHVADLIRHTRGNQSLETALAGSGHDLDVFSTIGSGKRVTVFDGDHLFTCAGSRVVNDFGRDRVRQVIPVDCLYDPAQGTLRSSALLTRNVGSTIAIDKSDRTRSIRLG